MKNVLIYLCLVLLCACTTAENQQNNQVYNINLSELPDDIMNLEDIVSEVTITTLETSEKCMIGFIGQLHRLDSYILVLDQMSLRIMAFDLEGNFSHFIGTIGKGPGEYIYPFGFNVIRKTKEIMLYDTRRDYAIWYDIKGAMIREMKVEAYGHQIGLINDTLIGLHGGRMGFIGQLDQHFELWVLNQQGEVVDSLFHYRDAMGTDMGAAVIPSHHDDFCYYSKIGDFSIYKLDGQEIDTTYRFDFGEANLDTAKYLSDESQFEIHLQTDKVQSLFNVSNTLEDFAFTADFNYKPVAYVLVNHDSRNSLVLPTDTTVMGKYYNMPLIVPRFSDHEYRHSYLNAIDWISYLETIPEEDKESLRSKVKGFAAAEKLTEEDNPIIISFKFKDF